MAVPPPRFVIEPVLLIVPETVITPLLADDKMMLPVHVEPQVALIPPQTVVVSVVSVGLTFTTPLIVIDAELAFVIVVTFVPDPPNTFTAAPPAAFVTVPVTFTPFAVTMPVVVAALRVTLPVPVTPPVITLSA